MSNLQITSLMKGKIFIIGASIWGLPPPHANLQSPRTIGGPTTARDRLLLAFVFAKLGLLRFIANVFFTCSKTTSNIEYGWVVVGARGTRGNVWPHSFGTS